MNRHVLLFHSGLIALHFIFSQIDYLAHDGPSNSLPVYSDFLTCVSTVPGFTSIRHTQDGSWFIQTLCEKLGNLARAWVFMQ